MGIGTWPGDGEAMSHATERAATSLEEGGGLYRLREEGVRTDAGGGIRNDSCQRTHFLKKDSYKEGGNRCP